jgi:hypothetical protein
MLHVVYEVPRTRQVVAKRHDILSPRLWLHNGEQRLPYGGLALFVRQATDGCPVRDWQVVVSGRIVVRRDLAGREGTLIFGTGKPGALDYRLPLIVTHTERLSKFQPFPEARAVEFRVLGLFPPDDPAGILYDPPMLEQREPGELSLDELAASLGGTMPEPVVRFDGEGGFVHVDH